MSLIETNDDKWIFFCPKDSKYKNGKQSNRATRAGYWKATGKDRSIKSVNGTAVIGTKKTLVFYTGRAPKGQRTDWVIHEYSATSEGLGGSNPGQASFLLFTLLKKHEKKLDRKQDESTEGLNCNEVDKNVSSSATIISSMPSELATPTMNALAEKLPSSSNSCLAQNSESLYDRCAAADDLEFEQEVWRHLVDPNLEPLYSPGKIFSPLHSPWYSLCSNDMHLPISNDVGPDHNAVQSPYGTNELHMAQHLCIILAASVEQTRQESGSYKNLAVEAGQSQFDPETSSNNSNAVNNGDISGTEIKLRTRQRKARYCEANFMPKLIARRKHVRFCLYSSSDLIDFRDLSYNEESHKAKLVMAMAEEAEEKRSVTADPAATIDETWDTYLSKSNDVTIVVQEPASDVKSRSDFPGVGNEEVPSAVENAPASVFSYKCVLGVLLAVGLPIVIISLRRRLA